MIGARAWSCVVAVFACSVFWNGGATASAEPDRGLSGRVREGGEPVQGIVELRSAMLRRELGSELDARLAAFVLSDILHSASAPVERATATSSSGEWRIDDVPAGRWIVSLVREGVRADLDCVLHVPELGSEPIDVDLRPGESVVTVAVTVSGVRPRSIQVGLRSRAESAARVYWATTDAEGRMSTARLPGAYAEVVCVLDGSSAHGGSFVSLDRRRITSCQIDLRLETATLDVARWAPDGSAAVICGGGSKGDVEVATVDRGGRLTTRALASQGPLGQQQSPVVWLADSTGGFRKLTLRAVDGRSDPNSSAFELADESRVIRGTVRDGAGLPRRGVVVTAGEAAPEGTAPAPIAVVVSDATGSFQIRTSASRACSVSATGGGWASLTPEVVQPRDSGTDRILDLAIWPTARAEVIVLDSNSKPVSGAKLWFTSRTESLRVRRASIGRTPVMELHDLPLSGEVEVAAQCDELGRASEPCAIPRGVRSTLRLAPARWMDIRVTDETGAVVPGVVVKAFSRSNRGRVALTPLRTTDAEGRIRRFGPLPMESCEVLAGTWWSGICTEVVEPGRSEARLVLAECRVIRGSIRGSPPLRERPMWALSLDASPAWATDAGWLYGMPNLAPVLGDGSFTVRDASGTCSGVEVTESGGPPRRTGYTDVPRGAEVVEVPLYTR